MTTSQFKRAEANFSAKYKKLQNNSLGVILTSAVLMSCGSNDQDIAEIESDIGTSLTPGLAEGNTTESPIIALAAAQPTEAEFSELIEETQVNAGDSPIISLGAAQLEVVQTSTGETSISSPAAAQPEEAKATELAEEAETSTSETSISTPAPVQQEETNANEPVDIAQASIDETSISEPAAAQPEEVEVSEPIVEAVIVEETTVEEPTVDEPTIEEPTIEEPTVEEPTIEEVVDKVEQPAIEENVNQPDEQEAIVQDFLQPVFSVEELGLDEAMSQLTAAKTGTLLFPSGKFEVEGISSSKTILNFDGFDGLMLAGQGDSTEIILIGDNDHPFVKPIKITNSNNIIVKNLQIEGNKQLWNHLTEFYEHQSNIFIRYSSNIAIDNVSSYGAFGDAINIGDVSDVAITNNRFDNTSRNGITIGYGFAQNITIDGNLFGSTIDTQQIDLEHGTNKDLVIRNNIFTKLRADGVDQLAVVINSAEGAQIYDNIIEGSVLFRNASSVDFRNNNGITQMTLDRESVDVVIQDNEFNLEPSNWGASRNFPGILLRAVDDLYPNRVTFSDNVIHSKTYSNIIEISDIANLAVNNNSFILDNNATEIFKIIAREIDMRVDISDNSATESSASPVSVLTPTVLERNSHIVIFL